MTALTPASAYETSEPAIYNVGDIVEFGEITWRILDIQEGKKLLLSEYVLKERAFHNTFEHTNWAASDIRHYLNYDFYNGFTVYERSRIALTSLENSDNPWFQAGRAGPDTYDKIFLLSLNEVIEYFGDSGGLQTRPPQVWPPRNWISDDYSPNRIAYDLNDQAAMWWLRTPGFNRNVVTGIRPSGDIYMDGAIVSVDIFGIRPALWLYLQ
jgi:hypothetical protein